MGVLRWLVGRLVGDEPADTPSAQHARHDRTGDPDVLDRYADRWEPADGGMGWYVVYPPEDGPGSVRRCETLEAVRRRLEHWYDAE